MLAGCKDSIACVDNNYRVIAESLFRPVAGDSPEIEAIENFADILGIGAEFKRLIREGNTTANETEFRRFLAHFQNNLALLISKTWVEKSDENKKECLRRKVPGLISLIEKGDYENALLEFGAILDELAFLFFGNQSLQADFTEYTLRIDTQMGLFWWYGSQIRTQNLKIDTNILRALLLIGICYLTSF
ncbi:MAG: hypothetical protein LBC27_02395 [Spirochaetaceae bacterium]|jgi:hypothetical protein|nr:hypothetical protein [Spirochaetaceae bacterium]